MASPSVRVLLIEDNPGDAKLFHVMLAEQRDKFSDEHADRLSIGLERLKNESFDVVLLDLSLPDSQGPQTFEKVRTAFPDMPVVLLTGLNDQELGIRAMREGVQDYLIKGQVDAEALMRSIRYAIERKRSDLLVRETQKALTVSVKMAALGTMAGGVAHEVNSPLTAINLIVPIAKEEMHKAGFNNDNVNKLLDDLTDMIQRIARITKGLRTFARDAQADPMVLTSVKSIVDDTLAVCLSRFKEHDIALKQQTPEDLNIRCRSSQIAQVLLNLLNNSFDAVRDLPEKWVEIEAKEHDAWIEIGVTDSGKGIAKDIADKLFDPFFTTKALGQGTGLGLSISKGLIEGHEGQIFVDESCSNTRIVLRFPKMPS